MNWIVVNTHAHRESQAQANLGRQGYEVYNPVIRKSVRHARRVTPSLKPLFPGYVFVNLSAERTVWRPIASTLGVRSVVRNGDAPSLLDERFVSALKARETDGVICRPFTRIEVGQTVRLSGGPFDGLAANIIEMAERDRLVVLLNFLSQPVRVAIAADQISPV
ncbi:MAG: transcription termination/antitermination protein NusG [Hyphomicrobium sp.]